MKIRVLAGRAVRKPDRYLLLRGTGENRDRHHSGKVSTYGRAWRRGVLLTKPWSTP